MVDILAIGAHPDDCEIFMGGTLFHLKNIGKEIAICDLTKGELGTYGDENTRPKKIFGKMMPSLSPMQVMS